MRPSGPAVEVSPPDANVSGEPGETRKARCDDPRSKKHGEPRALARGAGHEMKALRRSERAAARVCCSSASNCSAITLAAQCKRTVRFTAIALRPAAVSETRRRRPWVVSSRRLTQPSVSSAATIAPMDCGVIASARAKSAVVAGPSVSKRLSTRSCGYGSVSPGTILSADSARARRRNATVISRSSSASSSGVGRLTGTERILPCGRERCQANFYSLSPLRATKWNRASAGLGSRCCGDPIGANFGVSEKSKS